jgi:hypothetical protein
VRVSMDARRKRLAELRLQLDSLYVTGAVRCQPDWRDPSTRLSWNTCGTVFGAEFSFVAEDRRHRSPAEPLDGPGRHDQCQVAGAGSSHLRFSVQTRQG